MKMNWPPEKTVSYEFDELENSYMEIPYGKDQKNIGKENEDDVR